MIVHLNQYYNYYLCPIDTYKNDHNYQYANYESEYDGMYLY